MPTTIIAAATNSDADTGSYFEHAARAARECLEQAEIAPDRVGMLINAGVYRDNNIVEPAVAALVQKRIGMGLRYAQGNVASFSFDLMNGASGVLHALAVVDSFFASEEVDYALVIAGDTHPSTQLHVPGFPYTSTGAALLLERDGSAGGFGRLYTAEPDDGVEPLGLVPLNEVGTQGRASMVVHADAGDPLHWATEAVRACLVGESITAADFSANEAVLLAPEPVPGFAKLLAAALDLPSEAVLALPPEVGDPHTAAPIFGYATAQTTARTVLFSAADGTSAACLPYRPTERP
ncbi:hypothetical protein [Nocardia nepalensis]|uniref:hypothetical protein n=1 Tax=Nocardia nepalensis TaxID=3375448 RepID=UPI003B6845E2